MNSKVVNSTLISEFLALLAVLQRAEICLNEVESEIIYSTNPEPSPRRVHALLESLNLLYTTSYKLSKRWQSLHSKSYSETYFIKSLCKEIKGLIDITQTTTSTLKRHKNKVAQPACSLQLKRCQQVIQRLVRIVEGSINIHQQD